MNKPNTANPAPKTLTQPPIPKWLSEVKEEHSKIFRKVESFKIGNFDFTTFNSPLPAVESVIKYSNSSSFRGNAEVPEVRVGIPIRTMMKIKSNLVPAGTNLLQTLGVDSKYIILVGAFLFNNKSSFSSYNTAFEFEKSIVLPGKVNTIKINPADGDSIELEGIILDFKIFTVTTFKTYYSITILYSKLPVRQVLSKLQVDTNTPQLPTSNQIETGIPSNSPDPEPTETTNPEATETTSPDPNSEPTTSPEETETPEIRYEKAKKLIETANILNSEEKLSEEIINKALNSLKEAISLLDKNTNSEGSDTLKSKAYRLAGNGHYNLGVKYHTSNRSKSIENYNNAISYYKKVKPTTPQIKSKIEQCESFIKASQISIDRNDRENQTKTIQKLLNEAKKLKDSDRLDKLIEAYNKANDYNNKELINKTKKALFELWYTSAIIWRNSKKEVEAQKAIKEAQKYIVTEEDKQKIKQFSKPAVPSTPKSTPTPTPKKPSTPSDPSLSPITQRLNYIEEGLKGSILYEGESQLEVLTEIKLILKDSLSNLLNDSNKKKLIRAELNRAYKLSAKTALLLERYYDPRFSFTYENIVRNNLKEVQPQDEEVKLLLKQLESRMVSLRQQQRRSQTQPVNLTRRNRNNPENFSSQSVTNNPNRTDPTGRNLEPSKPQNSQIILVESMLSQAVSLKGKAKEQKLMQALAVAKNTKKQDLINKVKVELVTFWYNYALDQRQYHRNEPGALKAFDEAEKYIIIEEQRKQINQQRALPRERNRDY